MAGETDIKDGDEQSPNWVSPDIYEPKSGAILPGFMVKANIDVLNPSKWQLKIMEGDKQLYFVEESAGQWFNHYVPEEAVNPGSNFVVHVHYFLTLAWSQWASVSNLVMGISKPVITEPVESANTNSRPRVSGRGYPGATVKLYHAGYGTILYGEVVVEGNGTWETVPFGNFPEGAFELTANQTYNNVDSEWADSVNIFTLSAPTILFPVDGSETTIRPRVSGRGYPGATVKLHHAGYGAILYGTAVVDENGHWETIPVVNFPEGVFELTARQAYNNFDSEWSYSAEFLVKALSPPTILSPANGSVVTTNRPSILGRGFPGALVKLYQANVGNTVFGSTYVLPSGLWGISPSVNFPEGGGSMTAIQSFETETSDWASAVTITVDL